MVEVKEERIDESAIGEKIPEMIMRMLSCLSGRNRKNCKQCEDVEACFFLIEAIITCRCGKREKV